jgi:hypothetical protein
MLNKIEINEYIMMSGVSSHIPAALYVTSK